MQEPRSVRKLLGALTWPVLFGASLVACHDAASTKEGRVLMVSKTFSASPTDIPNAAAAERVLREYLDASRESNADRTTVDALSACGDEGQAFFPTTLLAGYTLLPFETRGDTIVGRAEVVTVAEQDIDRRSDGFTARERIQRYTFEWDVIPTSDGAFMVCNGVRFGYFGADSLTTWRPEGSSYATARRLADSISRTMAGHQ